MEYNDIAQIQQRQADLIRSARRERNVHLAIQSRDNRRDRFDLIQQIRQNW